MFLRDLTEHATQREFVYSHMWKPGDLVMWDNRATTHRARRFRPRRDSRRAPDDARRAAVDRRTGRLVRVSSP